MYTPKLGKIILDNAKLQNYSYGFQLTNGTTDRYIPSLLYEIHDTYFFNLIHDLLPSFHQTTSKALKRDICHLKAYNVFSVWCRHM